MLVFVTGCPVPVACTTDADCADNGVFCDGAEVCVDGVCASAGNPCAEGETCNEEADRCDVCAADADCDDGLYCNGTETCVDGQCVAGTNPCAADEMCDEDNDACVECLADADCDDGVFCNGAEACDNGACVAGADPCDPATEVCREELGTCTEIECATNADCDDALFCNGPEVCIEQLCADGPDPCTADEICLEDTAECVECVMDEDCDEGLTCIDNVCTAGTPCVEDADCDDLLFCNGVETCGVDGFCVAGTEPCDDGLFCNGVETCDEDANVCLDGPDPCDPVIQGCDEENDVCTEIQQFVLTTDIDVLTGTEGADVFRGTDETADTGDLINGRGGVDRFDWITTGAEGDLIDTVSVELVFVRNTFGGQTIDLAGFEDFTQLWFDRGTADLILENVPAIAAVGYTGGNGDGDFDVEFDGDLVDGPEDALSIFLDGADGNDLTFDGFETFNVNIAGDNTLDDLESNELETVNLLGGSSLEIDNVIEDAETFDASGCSADLDIRVDDLDITYIGGSGTDVIRFGLGEFDADDDVDGGEGDADLLVIALDGDVTNFDPEPPISNVEILSLQGNDDGTGGQNFTLDLDGVTGITTVRVEALGGANADVLELDELAAGPALVFRGDGNDADQLFDGVTIAFASSVDTLDVTVNNRDEEDLDENNRTITIGQLDIDDVADLTLTLEDGGDLELGQLNGLDLETLTITANSSVTIGDDITPLESEDVDTVDAMATDGGVYVNNSNATVSADMTGGEGNDTLISGEGLDDVLIGGDGDDTLRGGPGDDTLNGGDGSDIFQWNDGDEGAANDTGEADRIPDFAVTGDEDVISIQDAGALDVVGAVALAFNLEGASGAGDNVVVFNANAAALTTAADIEDVIQANHGQAGEAIIAVVLCPDDNVYVVYDDDSGVDGAGAGILVLAVIDEIDGSDPTAPADLDDFTAGNFELRP